MPTLLIVHHTPSPATAELFDAVLRGATEPAELAEVEVVRRPALAATASDVLAADGYLLGTPANLGYMSGALKHFFDTVYYPILDATGGRPYGLYVHGNLGTEGAGYDDVGIAHAIEIGIVPGPRVIPVTRAIVATGAYAPRGFVPEFAVPQGAEEASGVEELTRVVRDQISKGARWIKVYADFPWGPTGETRPTFTAEELARIVEVAGSAGVPVVAHASADILERHYP